MWFRESFSYAVDGCRPTKFNAGDLADEAPKDVRDYAERKGLLTDDEEEIGKSIKRSPEDKARKGADETKKK